MEYNITFRRKDGGWQYIISFKEDGKWKQRSKQGFKTRALAKVAADKRLDELKELWETQVKALPEHQGLTFKEFVDMYKKHKQLHTSYNTIWALEIALKHFDALNNLKMSEIQLIHTQLCVDNMVKKGLAFSTVKLYIARIKTVFNAAIKPYNIVNINPFDDILLTKKTRTIKKVKALTKKELENLLNEIKNPKYYIICLLTAQCGLRLGEILGLTWDRIDFKNALLTVNRQWKLLEKGVYGFGTPKSELSYRDVPIPASLLAVLLAFKINYPVHISGRIIPYKNTLATSGNLAKKFEELGFDNSIHDLRHTYATHLLAAGVDFKTVAEYMGHDVEETIRTYSHVMDDMRLRATKIINEIF